eukprot:gene2421-2790_t
MRKNLVLSADMDKKTFQLQSSTNDRIQFELQFNSVGSRPHCTCPDFSRTRLPCKHFFYLFEKYSALTWSQLPSSYTENPFFTLDNDVLLVFNDHASAAQDNTQVTEIEEQANNCHEFSNDKKNEKEKAEEEMENTKKNGNKETVYFQLLCRCGDMPSACKKTDISHIRHGQL